MFDQTIAPPVDFYVYIRMLRSIGPSLGENASVGIFVYALRLSVSLGYICVCLSMFLRDPTHILYSNPTYNCSNMKYCLYLLLGGLFWGVFGGIWGGVLQGSLWGVVWI